MRLHELAKEMEADSKELLALAKKLSLRVKSHSSNLAPGEMALLRVGYRFRDLDEDEIYDRLEQEAEQREADEKAAKEAKVAEARAMLEAPPPEEVAEATEAEVVEVEADVGAEVAEPEGVAAEAAAVAGEVVAEATEVESGAPQEAAAAAETEKVAASADGAKVVAGAPVEGGAEKKIEAGAKDATKPDRRRGAKILGRIELEPAELNRPEPAGERGVARAGGPVTPGARRDTKDEAQQRRNKKTQPKVTKWTPDPEDFAPVTSAQIARPRFWERGPQRRQGRRGSGPRKPRGPKKNLQENKKVIVVPPITVKDLSQELGIRAGDILARLLMAKGVPLTINSFLDEDMVLTVAAEFSRDIEVRREQDVERDFLEKEGGEELASSVREEESPAGPDARSPVVVFMGHVDHGKTSLLDRIRESKVVDTEHGGITQHIRAYQVMTPRGGKVTFLDTPGHRAFTEMRARGANCTDIVVLVVAADDGVMPQTREAIDHARAANPDMPLVVALNKIDRPEADAMKVKQELMAMDLLPEEFGGKVGVIETSAQTGQGIDALLERLALEAEVRDLRADGTGRGRGYVIEASKQEGKGIHATILVRDGTLRVRDPFLCGDTWGRVRMMENDQGQSIKEAGPSMPVVVYGFKGDVPSAGDLFLAVQDERGAERVASERHIKTKEGTTQSRSSVTLENLFASLDAGKVHEICVVLKADVQGSVEVLERELDALQHSEVKVRVLRSAVGAVTEEDIMLANTSQAIVIGFGVIAEAKARRLQENLGVDLRHYNVIYELLDDLKKAMAGVLKPEETEKVIGHVEIREVFKVSRTGSIAGCFVLDGMIRRSDKVRVTREGKVIYTTTLESLRRFKDDVREVKEGFECGIKLTNFDDIKVSDIIEVFEIVFEERELSLS